MEFDIAKAKIEKSLAELIEVEETTNLDDIKEIELLEDVIQNCIYQYCIRKGYALNGFPFKQMKYCENDINGYDDDYFSPERIDYYICNLGIEKSDVRSLFEISILYHEPEADVKKVLQEIIDLHDRNKLSFDI